jgi:signal peptidase I
MDEEGAQSSSPLWLRLVFGRNPTVTFLRIIFLILVSLIVFKFILIPIRVTGDSMDPTYKNGQVRFVNRLAYMRHAPQRADVVAVEFEGQRVLLLKRIIGLPNERFRVFNGDVYINGELLEEPYAHGKIPGPSGTGLGSTVETINLGPTEYMVIGDNRSISEGFRKDRVQIVGKVL